MTFFFKIAHKFKAIFCEEHIDVIWYERDYKNLSNQHHDHEEYEDIKGIRECLLNPDTICKIKKYKERYAFYRDRGNFLFKWHKVVIQKKKNKAILITTFYNDKININEEKIWP